MNAGKTFFDLTLAESVPAGSLYAVEMGDGSGTKSVTHEKVVESIGESLPLGNIENLQTIAKDNLVSAINEINKKSESGGSTIDDSKIGNLNSLTTIAKDNLVNAINEIASKEIDILDTKELIEANTQTGKVAGALAVKIIAGEVNQLKKSVSDGKSLIASAITAKGVTTTADATFSVMAGNIRKIKNDVKHTVYCIVTHNAGGAAVQIMIDGVQRQLMTVSLQANVQSQTFEV